MKKEEVANAKSLTLKQLDNITSNQLLKAIVRRWSGLNPRIDHTLQLLRQNLIEADLVDESKLHIPDLYPYGGRY